MKTPELHRSCKRAFHAISLARGAIGRLKTSTLMPIIDHVQNSKGGIRYWKTCRNGAMLIENSGCNTLSETAQKIRYATHNTSSNVETPEDVVLETSMRTVFYANAGLVVRWTTFEYKPRTPATAASFWAIVGILVYALRWC